MEGVGRSHWRDADRLGEGALAVTIHRPETRSRKRSVHHEISTTPSGSQTGARGCSSRPCAQQTPRQAWTRSAVRTGTPAREEVGTQPGKTGGVMGPDASLNAGKAGSDRRLQERARDVGWSPGASAKPPASPGPAPTVAQVPQLRGQVRLGAQLEGASPSTGGPAAFQSSPPTVGP